jgi:hypothetical protein
MKTGMWCAALAACLTASLAACGGGGGNAGSAGAPSTPPASTGGNLDAYVGTWTSACASHAVDTAVVARAAGASNALTIAVTTSYYANTACTGDVIATQVWSAATTATYVGTVASSIMPGAVAASIDKVKAQLPQRSVTLTGTFVSHKIIDAQPNWCIDYAGGSVCVPDKIYAAEPAPFDGLAIQGSELVEVKSNGVNYDAVERFTKR